MQDIVYKNRERIYAIKNVRIRKRSVFLKFDSFKMVITDEKQGR